MKFFYFVKIVRIGNKKFFRILMNLNIKLSVFFFSVFVLELYKYLYLYGLYVRVLFGV